MLIREKSRSNFLAYETSRCQVYEIIRLQNFLIDIFDNDTESIVL